MKLLVGGLRKGCRVKTGFTNEIQVFLRSRNVVSVETVQNLHCDGALQPIGINYASGFKVLVRNQKSPERFRFTLAHELCHTFFYELVPEIKFSSHEIDPSEERLCNVGAAELLMPSTALRKSARTLPVCLDSLRRLANEYMVSLTAMFLRLRALQLWNCEMSEWYRMSNGNFELENFYGGPLRRWEWEDAGILRVAWSSSRSAFGHTFVRYQDDQGIRYYRPTKYEVRRVGSRLFALWGVNVERPSNVCPLFEDNAQAIAKRKRGRRSR